MFSFWNNDEDKAKLKELLKTIEVLEETKTDEEKANMKNNKDHGEENNNSSNFPNGFITITSTNGTFDPSILNFLPPEIQQSLMQDIGGNKPLKKEEAPQEEKTVKKIDFDFKMINCNTDLKELTKKLKKSKFTNYGILLYGVSGAGKSYFAQYLAQELKMPFIKKRASDLKGKWVGETEQNIKNAFLEAKKKNAILLFDEADSFLMDRKYADRDHEVSSVNELLTQVEDHPLPFIMTTNLKEKIDPASMRRFIFKIKYDYMTKDNIKAGVKTYFGKQFKLTTDQLEQLEYICPGDFKVAKRKIEILEDNKPTNELIYNYLLNEQDEKNITKGSNKINF